MILKIQHVFGIGMFLLLVLGITENNAFGFDLETTSSQYPVYLYDNFGNKYGKIWIIEASPKLISIKVENKTTPNIESGIVLYDKYLQWDGKNIDDLKYNALTWKENFSFFSYILPVEERYVIIIIDDQKSILDKVTISYNQVIQNELISGAIIALVGVFIGAISGAIRDSIKDAGKTRNVKYTIRSDLEYIKNIINNAIENEHDNNYLMNHTKISSISTKVYDELHLEITRLLFPIYSNRIRATYQKIRELVNPKRIELSNGSREINKIEIDSILNDINDVTERLQSFYEYRMLGKILKQNIKK
ncbi:exported hypothetical protein [metagenome]